MPWALDQACGEMPERDRVAEHGVEGAERGLARFQVAEIEGAGACCVFLRTGAFPVGRRGDGFVYERIRQKLTYFTIRTGFPSLGAPSSSCSSGFLPPSEEQS